MGVFYKEVSPCQMKYRDPSHVHQVNKVYHVLSVLAYGNLKSSCWCSQGIKNTKSTKAKIFLIFRHSEANFDI